MHHQSLPSEGYVRLATIVGKPATKQSPAVPGVLPMSASHVWRMVRAGTFPKPVKLAGNITAWRVDDIRDLIDRIGLEGVDAETNP